MQATDPTFYRSPVAAAAAAPEQIAYVAAFDPAGQMKDALAVVREILGLLNAWAGLPVRPHSS